MFTLIFTPDGQLDPTYCDQYPWERKLQVCAGWELVHAVGCWRG